MYIYIYIHIYMYIYTYIHIYMYVYVHFYCFSHLQYRRALSNGECPFDRISIYLYTYIW